MPGIRPFTTPPSPGAADTSLLTPACAHGLTIAPGRTPGPSQTPPRVTQGESVRLGGGGEDKKKRGSALKQRPTHTLQAHAIRMSPDSGDYDVWEEEKMGSVGKEIDNEMQLEA